jgi:chaperone required for assembly of F1-ATPase
MSDQPPNDPRRSIRADAMNARPLPKRFYKDVTVSSPPPGGEGTYRVLLDHRPAKTPGKKLLAVEQRALAEAIAAEWAAQVGVINPATMPLTTLAMTAIDAVTGREAEVAAEIVNYAGSDLLCYRADGPATLVKRQAEHWDPVLTWAASDLGARFVLSEGVMHVAQPAGTIAAIARATIGVPALPLAALHVMTTLTGSALLALAVARGRLSSEEAWMAAHVDEDFQIAQWGEDAEAVARRATRWAEMQAAARVVQLTAAD